MKVTAYYGGDLEGNSIRRLMAKGDEIYQEIADFLCEMNELNKIGNSNATITNEEIRTICKDYGNIFCLFDNVFAILNTK